MRIRTRRIVLIVAVISSVGFAAAATASGGGDIYHDMSKQAPASHVTTVESGATSNTTPGIYHDM